MSTIPAARAHPRNQPGAERRAAPRRPWTRECLARPHTKGRSQDPRPKPPKGQRRLDHAGAMALRACPTQGDQHQRDACRTQEITCVCCRLSARGAPRVVQEPKAGRHVPQGNHQGAPRKTASGSSSSMVGLLLMSLLNLEYVQPTGANLTLDLQQGRCVLRF